MMGDIFGHSAHVPVEKEKVEICSTIEYVPDALSSCPR